MERFYAIHNTPIFLGRQGEQNVRDVAFDISHWLELYGEGAVQLYARRPGDEDMYPVPLTREGNCVVWTVAQADVAKVGQTGECELSFQPGEDTLAKSEIWATFVLPAMDGDVTEAPDAAQAWIDALRKEVAAQQKIADQAAKSAQASAQSAGVAGTRAAAAAKSAAAAEEARDAITGMTVTAETLAPGEEATAAAILADGVYSLTLGLPRGEPGADGYAPVKGADYWTEEDKAEIIREASESLNYADTAPYVVEIEDTDFADPEFDYEELRGSGYIPYDRADNGYIGQLNINYDTIYEALEQGKTVQFKHNSYWWAADMGYHYVARETITAYSLSEAYGLVLHGAFYTYVLPNGSYHGG